MPRDVSRICQRCGRKRPLRFYKTTRGRICIDCQQKRSSSYSKDIRLQETYGISLEEYNAIVAAQDGECAICGVEPRYPLHVDHLHDRTIVGRAAVRGGLDKLHNGRLLPAARDDVGVLLSAVEYLDNPPAQAVLDGPRKQCRRCLKSKHVNGFPKDASRSDGLYPYCKLCHRNYQSAWTQANPERSRARMDRQQEKARTWREAHPQEYSEMVRRETLLRRYGVTPEWYGMKLEEQGGTCALCSRTPDMERHGVLAVDHDHSCCGPKKACMACVRSLLCFRHNAMLGNAGDDPAVLLAAVEYLQVHSTTGDDDATV